MGRGTSLGLWIVAAGMLVATAGLYFYEPAAREVRVDEEAQAELDAAIVKAATYFEFGHYERAAETYRSAIERGMASGVDWYRYARSIELSGEADLHEYAHAYALLLEQEPAHEFTLEAEAVLKERSEPFVYERVRSGELPEASLVSVSGTISRVVWGRVEDGLDALVVATSEDEWLGHSGDEIVVNAPRHRHYRAGDALEIIGFYSGWCTRSDGANLTREYPCVDAAGMRVVTP